jgi:uncharacterized iron-regulated membrane protein
MPLAERVRLPLRTARAPARTRPGRRRLRPAVRRLHRWAALATGLVLLVVVLYGLLPLVLPAVTLAWLARARALSPEPPPARAR